MYKLLCTVFAVVTLLFTQKSHAQDSKILTKGADETYSFEKVYEVAGKTKVDIFNAIKGWVVKNVKSQSNTNYFDETDKGSISTTPAFVVHTGAAVDFKMNIDIKDGKYRLSATSFIFHNPQGIPKNLGDYSGLFAPKGVRKKIMEDVDDHFGKIIASVEEAANNKAADKSDW